MPIRVKSPQFGMKAEEFKRKLEEYTGNREAAFYWVDAPKTDVWFDESSNELCSSLGISIKCDDYETVYDCIGDLYEAVVEHYKRKGIYIHETEPRGS